MNNTCTTENNFKMDGWMDGWMDDCMDGWMDGVYHHFTTSKWLIAMATKMQIK